MIVTKHGNYRTEIDLLYAVADDYQADVLDALRDKAGLTWECYGAEAKPCRWTNMADYETCERCGAAKGTTDDDDA